MSIEYSNSAKSRIEEYLNAVQDRLKISESVDAQEVIDELNEHIERELSGKSQPISEADVIDVIHRLGPPEQFVDESDLSWRRKMVQRLQKGPEDWRLAYLSFGVFLLGTLITGPLGLIASFLLSRASLSVSGKAECQAKKWLLYPSLVVTYAILLGFGLLWPAALGGAIGDLNNQRDSILYQEPYFDHDGVGTVLAAFAGGGLGFSVWWSVLWILGRKYPSRVRDIFRPFADNWTGKTFGKIIAVVWCLTIVLAGVAVWLWFRT